MGTMCLKNISKNEFHLNLFERYFDNFLCSIKLNNENDGLGFFCKIFPNRDKFGYLPVLITTNKIIGQKDIESNKKIIFYLKGNETPFQIVLDNTRIIYTNEREDITIIEVKQNDELNINSFLEVNNQINDEELLIDNNDNNNYSYKAIYLLYYEHKKNIVKECKIKKIFKGTNFFEYISKEENPKLGSPLILKKEGNGYNVIGIHKAINKENNYYIGMFIKEPIKSFFEKKNINKLYNMKIFNLNHFIDEIKIEYKIDENKNIRIFGDEFVNNNKNICKIIINKKEEELCSFYDTENIELNNNILKVTLTGINNITDINSLFAGCDTLIFISNLNFNTSKITNMNNMFFGCEKLEYLPDISNWNTKNVTDISGMFSGCSSLKIIPNISKWNTSNITDMNNLFSGCLSLKTISDLFEWDTKKVTNMKNIFNKCSSLETIPDISKWDTNNVSNMSNFFSECSSLKNLPDISKWKTNSLINITRMFFKCSSLLFLPDISIWDIKNIKYMTSLFEGCSSLQNLPNISKWKTDNIGSMFSLFSGCQSLLSLPDISKWNTKNVTDMNSMFQECKSLKVLPDISKWNTNNVTDMSSMFENCTSLSSLPDISKWNIKNVIYKSNMFEGCNSNLKIPEKFK